MIELTDEEIAVVNARRMRDRRWSISRSTAERELAAYALASAEPNVWDAMAYLFRCQGIPVMQPREER